MRSLLKSKKGGIPAINEIVITVMGILPTPVKIFLFLLLITTISGFVLPLMLNMFGYACVDEFGSTELYQVPVTKVFTKTLFDIGRSAQSFLLPQDYLIPEDPHPDGDKRYLKIPSQCYVSREVNDTTITGYSGGCVDCEIYKAGFVETILYVNHYDTFCIDDGFTVERPFHTEYCQQCSPPYPYYYNHTECLAFGQDQCYFTITDTSLLSEIGSDYSQLRYLENILSLGGVRRQQDSSDITNIQCSAVGKPNLFVFSIELFNRTMWIFLFIGYFLITFAYLYYGVVLK